MARRMDESRCVKDTMVKLSAEEWRRGRKRRLSWRLGVHLYSNSHSQAVQRRPRPHRQISSPNHSSDQDVVEHEGGWTSVRLRRWQLCAKIGWRTCGVCLVWLFIDRLRKLEIRIHPSGEVAPDNCLASFKVSKAALPGSVARISLDAEIMLKNYVHA